MCDCTTHPVVIPREKSRGVSVPKSYLLHLLKEEVPDGTVLCFDKADIERLLEITNAFHNPPSYREVIRCDECSVLQISGPDPTAPWEPCFICDG